MAKIIRKVGRIFFPIVISILLVVGCAFAINNVAIDKNDNSQNLNNQNNESAVADSASTFELSGTNTQMATKWSEAINYAYSNKGTNVTVKLLNDWNAPTTGDHYFGTGSAFGNQSHSLYIYDGMTVTLDLNGHSINRGLTKETANLMGRVITVDTNSTLSIKDSSYNSTLAKSTAPENLSSLPFGKIKGGANNKANSGDRMGGGIIVKSNATLNFYGGIVTNNYCRGNGGGIFVTGGAKLNFYDGIVCNNFSDDNGASIYTSQATANIYDGIVSNNNSHRTAGLRAFNRATLNIFGGIITNNTSCIEGNDVWSQSTHAGGISLSSSSILNLSGGTIKNNKHATNGVGGIMVETIDCFINISGNPQVYDNTNAENTKSGIHFAKNYKIRIDGKLEKDEKSAKIAVNFAYDYDIFSPFTVGYSYYGNKNMPPSKYFLSYNENESFVAKNDEVVLSRATTSIYDYIYLDSNNERQNYKDNDKLHGYNDSSLNIENGTAKYILGSISPNTSISEFVNNLEGLGIDKYNMGLFNSKGTLLYDSGSAMGIAPELLNNGKELAVGTGWYLKYNVKPGVTETIYLSVLGDVNGDGRLSASDVSYLRQIANDKALYESLSLEKKLACTIINKGEVTTADAEIVKNVIEKIFDINIFF